MSWFRVAVGIQVGREPQGCANGNGREPREKDWDGVTSNVDSQEDVPGNNNKDIDGIR